MIGTSAQGADVEPAVIFRPVPHGIPVLVAIPKSATTLDETLVAADRVVASVGGEDLRLCGTRPTYGCETLGAATRIAASAARDDQEHDAGEREADAGSRRRGHSGSGVRPPPGERRRGYRTAEPGRPCMPRSA